MPDPIFEPLEFRHFAIKNRILRSNVSGRFDNYDGSGNQARINWETRFARGGVGAIVSSFVPVTIRGRIIPNYATIDSDARIPFWREPPAPAGRSASARRSRPGWTSGPTGAAAASIR